MEKIIVPQIDTIGDLIEFLSSDFKVSDLTIQGVRYIGHKIVSYLHLCGQFYYLSDISTEPPFRFFILGSVYSFSHPDSHYKLLINLSCHENTEAFFKDLNDGVFLVGPFISRETSL